MDYGFHLDPGEQILRVIHRSFIDLVAPVFMSVALILVAAALAYMEGRFPTNLPFPPLVVLALVLVLTVVGALILLIGIYTFRRNVLIFTNFHLVEVEQPTLFSREVSQLSLARVQDVSGKRVGFWATIFDYGDVQIQSAGEQEKFIFHRAPHPEQVAEDALETRDHCVHMQGLETQTTAAMPTPGATASNSTPAPTNDPAPTYYAPDPTNAPTPNNTSAGTLNEGEPETFPQNQSDDE